MFSGNINNSIMFKKRDLWIPKKAICKFLKNKFDYAFREQLLEMRMIVKLSG